MDTDKYRVLKLSLFVLTLLMAGCGTQDPMVEEMDAAFDAAGNIKDRELKDKQQREAVSHVVQKSIPQGMTVEKTVKLLYRLKDRGFEIGEYRHEGARIWPGGELLAYHSEVSRRAYQPVGSMINYSASKVYERQLVIYEKRAVIKIQTNGKVVVASDGFIVPNLRVP